MPITQQTQYISVTEGAKALGVSRVTVYKWIANGRLDAAEIADRTVVLVNRKFQQEAAIIAR